MASFTVDVPLGEPTVASLAVAARVSVTPAVASFQRFSRCLRFRDKKAAKLKKTPENTALSGVFGVRC
jgi:hypothetical protein